MFEIRVICDNADAPEITKALNETFTTGAVRERPTRDGSRTRLYAIADHRDASASTVYAAAPSILREMTHVLDLTMDLSRPGGRTETAEREQKLRKAALLDRIALDEAATYAPDVAANAIEAAEEAALSFALYDGDDDYSNDPTGPNARIWAETSYRGYVRQEYTAWLREQNL
ncbi:hypothetical protein ABZ419_22975 [Streptomyces cinnamoneus]|uniref:hypothetical protein n=1 Tax=Streptomyces cinnamoneus TaxID=53446 RepID=UPI0033FB0C69